MSDGAVSLLIGGAMLFFGYLCWVSYQEGYAQGLLVGRNESGFAQGYLDGYETAKRMVEMAAEGDKQ